MTFSVVFASFAMGLGATASCMGICMPFFVPYVVSKDDNYKKGLRTAMFFSAGRLWVYMTLGLLFYYVIREPLDDVIGNTYIKGFRSVPIVLGIIIMIYGLWIIMKLPTIKVCPAKYRKSVLSIILGALIGSFICPPFILMLVANIDETVIIFIISVLMFWVGSSFSILVLGALSGKFSAYLMKVKSREWVRNVCAFVLIFTGIWFIISTFINN